MVVTVGAVVGSLLVFSGELLKAMRNLEMRECSGREGDYNGIGRFLFEVVFSIFRRVTGGRRRCSGSSGEDGYIAFQNPKIL